MNTRDKITEYELIVEDDADTFDEQINLHLRRGWTLWGAPGLLSGRSAQAFASQERRVSEVMLMPVTEERLRELVWPAEN